ncbi:MAG: hypothetical protein KatS3mg015_0255 [Fimbriimonadales bacterium]|nr:MAG: hypothetical protein KatS3mg015_0255 [Fimbriimonadales bacterium]
MVWMRSLSLTRSSLRVPDRADAVALRRQDAQDWDLVDQARHEVAGDVERFKGLRAPLDQKIGNGFSLLNRRRR